MKTIVLMGDPNVGKSVLFSRLTGVDVITANYPGTTVEYATGRITREGETLELIDAPGTYSLDPSNKAEAVAVSLLNKADAILNVVDATSLERCLVLTVELLGRGKPMIMALNLWDEAQHLGIAINVRELEERLGIPVIPTVAITGEGVNELMRRLPEACVAERAKSQGKEAVWAEVGTLVRRVQQVQHRHHSFRDRLEDATVKPIAGLLTAAVILAGLFWLVRAVGEGLIRYVIDPLFHWYAIPLFRLGRWLGPGFFRDVLLGTLTETDPDFAQAMGLLTTGVYMPFGMVLPYVIAFYFSLALLEDSGYLPRLATVTDNFFHRMGLHGHGIIAVLLGLGCRVPGILATRTLETPKQRFIAMTLVGLVVPCAAFTAMTFAVLGPHGARYILFHIGTLVGVFLFLGTVLNRLWREETPELFLEIPPYRRPSLRVAVKKTWMRLRGFFTDALLLLFLGVLVASLLDACGFSDRLARRISPLMNAWFGLPGDAALVLVAAFLRKEVAVGMLLPLALTPEQLTVAITAFSFIPCVATLGVMLREAGPRHAVGMLGVMVLLVFGVGGLLRAILLG